MDDVSMGGSFFLLLYFHSIWLQVPNVAQAFASVIEVLVGGWLSVRWCWIEADGRPLILADGQCKWWDRTVLLKFRMRLVKQDHLHGSCVWPRFHTADVRWLWHFLLSSAIHEFPDDLFSSQERKKGAVLLHILAVNDLYSAFSFRSLSPDNPPIISIPLGLNVSGRLAR